MTTLDELDVMLKIAKERHEKQDHTDAAKVAEWHELRDFLNRLELFLNILHA